MNNTILTIICLTIIMMSVWGADVYAVALISDYNQCVTYGNAKLNPVHNTFLDFQIFGEWWQELCWLGIIAPAIVLAIKAREGKR